jgi:fibronectin-binding autotransporter adhesin
MGPQVVLWEFKGTIERKSVNETDLPMKKTAHPLLISLFALLAAYINASAGVHVWSGAASTLWSAAGNWSSGGVPTAGETSLQLIFPFMSSGNKTTVDNVPGLVVDLMNINDGSYVFKGANAAKLTFSGAGPSSIISSGSGYEFESSLPLVINGMCEIENTSGTATFSNTISGSGGMEFKGFAVIGGTSANTYTGTTLVTGSLSLDKSAGLACFSGPLVIDEGSLSSSEGNAIPDNLPITVKDGTLFVSGGLETLGPLTLNHSNLKLDTTKYAVTFGATVTVTGGSAIYGNFSLGGPARIFDVASNNTLTVYGKMGDYSSGAGGFVKMGAGYMDLRAANDFSGAANIAAGAVFVNNSNGLGTPAGGVSVAVDAAVYLSPLNGDLAIGNETLNLSGKLRWQTNAIWSGPINLIGTASEFEGTQSVSGPAVLTHSGVISGSGQLKKTGGGRLILGGASANTYTGGTVLEQGDVYLSKSSGNAIPGDLNIVAAFVFLIGSEEIANNSNVILNGIIDFGARTETIGSLTGDNGVLKFALGTLITGGNNTSTTFKGNLSGYGNTCLIKNGTGNFTVFNYSGADIPTSLDGDITINAGALTVDGFQLGDVTVNTGGLLQGKGTVHNVVLNGGQINLSNLKIASLTSITNTSQITGDIQGENQFGHVKATGTVNLSGISFSGMLGYNPYAGASFLLIDNDGTDPVVGSFNGFPEGASVVINGRTFKISYHGGDGNDVVLLLIDGGLASPVVTSSSFHIIQGSGMHHHIEVHSQSNVLHGLQYSDDLIEWKIYPKKTATSDAQGNLVFDFDASPAPKRFFRVYIP